MVINIKIIKAKKTVAGIVLVMAAGAFLFSTVFGDEIANTKTEDSSISVQIMSISDSYRDFEKEQLIGITMREPTDADIFGTMKISGITAEGYSLYIDGEEAIAFENYNDMIEVLNELLDKYKIDNGETHFCEKVEFEKKNMSVIKLLNKTKALEYFEEYKPLKVFTSVVNEYSAAIEYQRKEIPDNSMYVGSESTITEGVPGEAVVNDEVHYIDGEEISRITVKKTVKTKPVDEVVLIGTLEGYEGVAGMFSYPVKGRITSVFGERWGRMHTGIDLAIDEGTPIRAAAPGKVIFAGECGTYGLLMKVDHNNGYVTYYAHCSGFTANVGDFVTAAEPIALVGNTGNSTGPHCHFEIRYNNEPLNPLGFLQ